MSNSNYNSAGNNQNNKNVSMPGFVNGRQSRPTARNTYYDEEDSRLQERLEQQRRASSRESQGRRKVNRKKKRRRRIFARVLTCMLAILAIAGGSAAARVKYEVTSAFSSMNRDTNSDFAASINEGNLLSEDDIVNILLIGSDKRATWKQTGRSDSVMIATIDNKHKQLKLTSLMRDMYLSIPGYEDNRFNAAYSFGGVNLMYQTIAENFGIKLDGYVLVDFAAFTDVIDRVGGVKLELTQEEYEYLTTAYHRGSVLKVKAGMNVLNGEQALAYTRIRQDARGDFGRTERQRKVIEALFTEAKSMSFTELYNMAKKILPNVSTDLTDDAIVSYMKTILFMGTTDISQLRIPVNNSYENQTIRGMKVLVPDLDVNKDVLSTFLFEDASKIEVSN